MTLAETYIDSQAFLVQKRSGTGMGWDGLDGWDGNFLYEHRSAVLIKDTFEHNLISIKGKDTFNS